MQKAAGFVLNKYVNVNDLINIKWLPIKERIGYSLTVMGFKAICDENVPKHLKLTQKVASTRNLRSNSKPILISVNQQSKTFEKRTGNIFNKLPTNIRAVEILSVSKPRLRTTFWIKH